jgi:hypothetical protein
VRDRTKTSNVLVWISTLGTTNGQSRTESPRSRRRRPRRERVENQPAPCVRCRSGFICCSCAPQYAQLWTP